MKIASFKPIHNYKLNIGKSKGQYKLFFDFDPENKNYAIPCRVLLKWAGVELDTGFRGEPEYNIDLVNLGYSQISSGTTNGFLTLFKDKDFPATAELIVYTPIEESLVLVSLSCTTEEPEEPDVPSEAGVITAFDAFPDQDSSALFNKTIYSSVCGSACPNIRAYFIRPSFDTNEDLYTPNNCSMVFSNLATVGLSDIILFLNVKTLNETIISIAYDSSYSGTSCILKHPLIQDLEIFLPSEDTEIII